MSSIKYILCIEKAFCAFLNQQKCLNSSLENEDNKIYKICFTGQLYDNDQELRAHPSGMADNEMEEIGYFERLGAKTEHFLERAFTAWGTWCASNPWLVLLLGEKVLQSHFVHAKSN